VVTISVTGLVRLGCERGFKGTKFSFRQFAFATIENLI
jgi:hypothetical protein